MDFAEDSIVLPMGKEKLRNYLVHRTSLDAGSAIYLSTDFTVELVAESTSYTSLDGTNS